MKKFAVSFGALVILLGAARIAGSGPAPALVVQSSTSLPTVTQFDSGVPPEHAAGVSQVGTYTSDELGIVNLANGALGLKIPMGNVGGRGFSLALGLNYCSKVWSAEVAGENVDTLLGQVPAVSAAYDDRARFVDIYNALPGSWSFGAVPTLLARGVGIGGVHNTQTGTTNFGSVFIKLLLQMPDKGTVEFRDDTTDGAPQTPVAGPDGGLDQVPSSTYPSNWHATDGSGMVFINNTPGAIASGDVSGVLVTADGMRYTFQNVFGPSSSIATAYLNVVGRCTRVTDRNGNTISIAYHHDTTNHLYTTTYTDQLGRTVTSSRSDNADIAPGATVQGEFADQTVLTVSFPGYNGQTQTYTVSAGSMNNHYDQSYTTPVINGDWSLRQGGDVFTGSDTELFPLSDQNGFEEVDNLPVIYQITCPDGRSYNFLYNDFGEVTQVTVPAGGAMQYQYSSIVPQHTGSPEPALPGGNSVNAEVRQHTRKGSTEVAEIDRAVTTRKSYPNGVSGGVQGTWSYTYIATDSATDASVSNGITEVTCTDAASGEVLHEKHYFLGGQEFQNIDANNSLTGTGYTLWSTGTENSTQTLDASGNVLHTVQRDWAQRAPVSWTGPFGGSSTQQIQNDNQVTESRNILDDGSTAKTDFAYDNDPGNFRANNATDVKRYDFDGSTVLKETVTSYVHANSYTLPAEGHLLRLPLTVQVETPPATTGGQPTIYATASYAYDESTPAAYSSVTGIDPNFNTAQLRGNPTTITMAGTPTLVIKHTYDTLGNTLTTTDGNGNVWTLDFTDNFGDGSSTALTGSQGPSGATYAFETKVTSPKLTDGSQQTASSEYDFNAGLLTGFKDRNGIVTQTIYSDPFNRPTEIKKALTKSTETHTHLYYAPASGPSVVGTLAHNDSAVAADQATLDDGPLTLVHWARTDGFGRAVNAFANAPEHSIQTDTVYDALDRRIKVSNPYRSGYTPPGGSPDTQQFAVTGYDLAGRVTTVTATDLAVTSTTYQGPKSTVTDAAGNQRAAVVDGAGRLVKVFEDPTHNNFETDYQYDPLDDLTGVNQVGIPGTSNVTRSFTYDGLKRLQSATNPESGRIGYAYDNNGNLSSKADARGIETDFSYDSLNRVTGRSYRNLPSSVGPSAPVTYTYDPGVPNGVGRLGSVSVPAAGASPASATSYDKFDEFGRVTQSTQTTAGTGYPSIVYTYDLAGEMLTEKYPSGRVVNMQYDAASRINLLSSGSTTYLQSFQYEAYGALSQVKLGNSLVETTTHNNRMQTSEVQLGSTAGSGSVLDLIYTFNSLQSGSNNNGNLLEQKIKIGGALIGDQTYSYSDHLNRLTGASETSPDGAVWSQTYQYDQFGNMAVTASTNITLTAATPQNLGAFYPGGQQSGQTKNQIANDGYDPAGNLTADATSNAYTYDAENRLTNFDTNIGTYSYDGDGRRVSKTTSAGTLYFVYDTAGKLIAEYGGQAGNSGTSYLTTDHLGSTRVVTNSSGAVIARHDYLPFGAEIGAVGGRTGQGYGALDDTRQKFTSKERDSESQFDYFEARYFSSAAGRFTSPDPDNAQGRGTPDDPQSWNAYSYVNNNPLVRLDPDGRKGFWQKLKNWWKYEKFETNEQLEKEVEEKREWLKLHVAEIHGFGYQVQNADFDKLGTGDVLRLYDQAQFDLEEAREGYFQHVKWVAAIGMVPGPTQPPQVPSDPANPPGPGWEWRGQGPPGGDKGAWFNPNTGETLHPDLNHPAPEGPHWDWRDPDGNFWRIYPDGRVEPRK